MSSGTVVKVAFGGMGIIKDQGMVVFIPYTLSGDRVAFEIKERKKKFAFGQLVQLFAPSKERIAPRCSYYGACGGCQLQHVDYSVQLELKRQWIADALQRIGGIAQPVVPCITPASQKWGYRRKIALTLTPDKGRFQMGYHAAGAPSLVSVNHCLIFEEEDSGVIALLQDSIAQLDPASTEKGRLSLLKTEAGAFLVHFHFDLFPINLKQVCETLHATHSCIAGIVASSKQKTLQWGENLSCLQVEGLQIQYSAAAFVQAHPDQSAKIYRLIVEELRNFRLPADAVVLDLYCGVGLSTLLLAREGFKVIGVELNREAVALARSNTAHNHVSGAVFHQGDVATLLPKLLQRHVPAALILNPPREGLALQVVQAILNSPSDYLVYISCMPPTLARDVKALQARYEVAMVKGFDMFPQTTHVETVLILRRKR